MKKLLAVTIAALLILSLASCGDKGDENTPDKKENVKAEEILTDATGTFEFDLNDAGKLEVVKFTPKGVAYVDVTLPSEFDKRDVVGIASEAFKGQTSVKSVTIPNTYQYIDDFAFYGCEYLEKVVIPETVTSIGRNAFAKCSSLKTVQGLQNVTTVSDYAFMDCLALTSADLSVKVATIGNGAFSGCKSLETVKLSEQLTHLGIGVFQDCDALKYKEEGNCKYLGVSSNEYFAVIRAKDYSTEKCTVNDQTVIVALDAFARSEMLKELVLGKGVKIMSGSSLVESNRINFTSYANGLYLGNSENPYMVLVKFERNTDKDFHISENTRIILDTAFENCMNLDTVHFEGNESEWKEIIKTEDWNFGRDLEMAYNATAPQETTPSLDESTSGTDESTSGTDENVSQDEVTTPGDNQTEATE